MNLVQQLINGLVLGHAYALIAIGWTLLLGVARLVNFGHGQMYMLGAFVAWWATAGAGMPYALAVSMVALAGLVLVAAALLAATAAAGGVPPFGEIGRASCRERVCQYV